MIRDLKIGGYKSPVYFR